MDTRVRFELLYRSHAPAVMAYLLRRIDQTAAEDVLAEVFVVCWRRADEVPKDPLPWLLVVARRVLSTERRSEQRRAALRRRLAEIAPEPPAVGSNAVEGLLLPALASLSEADRELLMLIAWDGLTPVQAATVLGVKPTTLRVRLLRARRRLAQALGRPTTVLSVTPPLPMESSG